MTLFCQDCRYFKKEALYGLNGKTFDGSCENLRVNSDPTRPLPVMKTNSCDEGEIKMSCRTCNYCEQQLISAGNGQYDEQLTCRKRATQPLVDPDDICEFYRERPILMEPVNAKTFDDAKDKILDAIKDDVISHPSHYTAGRKYEPKDVIRDWDLNFNLGSAVKYISRAGRKDDIIQDLKKAQQFIQFEIDYLNSKFGG